MNGSTGRVLVIGGARSGKSAYAESLLAGHPRATYVATAPERPDDHDWAARIAAHKLRRPPHWRTVETTDLCGLLRAPQGDRPLLVDSVTAWLTAAMDDAGSWTDDARAGGRLHERTGELVAAWSGTVAQVVAVTDEVGQGVVPDTYSARLFRDELGRLNQQLAAGADRVWLVTAGLPLQLK
ncbi:MAG TPA: bifunctional adenosylcobinamide kinase/adenosylcobinamide-phosphate guanylyltransferase [Mycobacteriales bacterium]|jgi:adenosylcobinamide kinase/adenosylcobinamide-phosphate guanylyltransferase|nr:bifunctional adenosylcobinamide kinase/adenosylcobinamide-phosphate guanylyltransferase [Mycobacteriales bacterium]